MKPHPTPLARAAALLLAAAALPLAPAIGQETSPPAESPATETPPPDATTSIPPPEATTPAPETPVTEAEAPAPAARTTTRRTTNRTVRTRVPATVPGPAIPVAVVPAPAPVESLPPVSTVPLPPPVAQTPPLEVLPETPPAPPVTTAVETRDSRDSLLPWLLGGLLLLGALAFFGLRGRRRNVVHDERVYERPPVATVPGEAVPLAAVAPVVTPVETVAPAGRPELDLTMRPVRAGISGGDARVEFQLTVGNSGPVAAENVRISTWMLAAGSSEAESALIVPRDHADTPPVTIGAGESRTMEASVALPTAEVDGDAVLPVVVADARYRLPDGSEGRTSASFAVGVPDGEELAHFGIENPSGLHEGVVARPLREPERV